MNRNGWLFAAIAAAAAAAVISIVALTAGSGDERSAKACPQGQRVVREEGDAKGDDAEREREKKGEPREYESHFIGKCAPVSHPESDKDLAKFNEYAAGRQGS